MNRKNSILKAAGIFLVVGLALYFVSIAAFASEKRGVLGNASTEIVYEEADYSAPAQAVNVIQIKGRNMPVTVTPSQGNEVVLHYYTCEEDPYDVTLEGGVLKLEYRNKNLFFQGSWFFGWGMFNNQNPRIEVLVPAAYAGNLLLNTSNGTISASNFPALGELRADTSNAAVNLNNLTAELVSVRTSNGAVTLEKVISSGRLTADTSNGSLTAKQTAAQEGLLLHTSNGRISVDQVTSKEIELRTSNASISGGVGGRRNEYTISSHTSNADNNLGSGGSGQFRLTVNTSNGAINLRFLGE